MQVVLYCIRFVEYSSYHLTEEQNTAICPRPLGIPFLKVTNYVPVLFCKNPDRKFPFIISYLFTSKHVRYCQKVAEIDSLLSTAQNSIFIAFKLTLNIAVH